MWYNEHQNCSILGLFMKTGVIKLLISIFSITILSIIILVNLFLEDVLTSKINDFLGKTFRTKSSLNDLDINFSDLSLTLNQFYVKSPVSSHHSNLIEFNNLSIQLEPSLAMREIVSFKKVTLDDLALYVSFNEGNFSSKLLSAEVNKSNSQIQKSPKFEFDLIEVRGLTLYLHTDDLFKEIEVPNFEIEGLLIGDKPIPPLVHFTRSLVKAILDESRHHVKTEVLNDLKVKLRKTILEKVGEKFRNKVSEKLKKILKF